MPPSFLNTIEQTAFSTWMRDSPSLLGFWFILSFHALGLALAVGTSALIDLRILGVAKELPLSTLKRLYPILWAGFWIQIVTGLLLLTAYPTKSLTTTAFYVKIVFIGAAMVLMVRLEKTLPSTPGETSLLGPGRRLAFWSVVLWIGAITAGRFIGYTAKYAMYPMG